MREIINTGAQKLKQKRLRYFLILFFQRAMFHDDNKHKLTR